VKTGAALVPSWFVMRESYAVVLLQRKAKRLRKETGKSKLRTEFDTELTQVEVIKLAIVRPMKMLLFSPATILMAVYMAFIFGEVYVLLTALSFVFDKSYGFGAGEIGLTFLGFGFGSMAGLFVVGAYSDRIMNQLVEANGGQRLPKYRLPFGILGGVVLPIGLLWFGWSADQKVHWVVPIIGTAVFGVGAIFSLVSLSFRIA
jgi:MFS family permease